MFSLQLNYREEVNDGDGETETQQVSYGPGLHVQSKIVILFKCFKHKENRQRREGGVKGNRAPVCPSVGITLPLLPAH